MPRPVIEARITGRSDRETLKARPGNEPHWRLLREGLHIGYRPRENGGVWVARRRSKAGGYQEQRIGFADDRRRGEADGINVLTYDQASDSVRRWAVAQGRAEAGLDPETGLPP